MAEDEVISIRVQDDDFDLEKEWQRLKAATKNIGAIVTFVGVVRELSNSGKLQHMELEHYPQMAENAVEEICKTALGRFAVDKIHVVHRVGFLYPTDNIVFVGIVSAHRKDALEACAFVMDFLKIRAPIWKKETTETGSKWVESKVVDEKNIRLWD